MSGTADIIVRDLRPEDRDAALGVLVDAFLEVEFPPADTRLLFGTGTRARKRARGLYGMMFEPRAKVSVAVAERDRRIVGVLTYVDAPACASPGAGQALRMARILGPRILVTVRPFLKASRVHPKEAHRHLPVLGVDPRFQGQGIGGRLMAEFARRCEEAGLDGYLEVVSWADARKPATRRLYERHGFVVTAEVPMSGEWSMLAMTRPLDRAPDAQA